jgi:hypothetical protein
MPKNSIGFLVELTVAAEQGGHAYVSSKQVPGLHLIGKCFIDMKPTIEGAIKRLFLDNRQQKVEVHWLASATQFPKTEVVLEKLAVFPSKAA